MVGGQHKNQLLRQITLRCICLFYVCEKLIGNNWACLGLGLATGRYYPKTVLQEDIRKQGNDCMRILAVYSKKMSEKVYKEKEYIYKNLTAEEANVIEEEL